MHVSQSKVRNGDNQRNISNMLKLRTPAYYDLHGISPKAKIYFLEPNETERTVIHVDSVNRKMLKPRTPAYYDLHEISPKAKIYFLEPNETERTVIHVDSEEEYCDLSRPNLEKNDCVKNVDVQSSPKLSRPRRHAVRLYPKDFKNEWCKLRERIKESSNGDSYSKKQISGSSNGDSYPRKPIKDSSNGDNYTRQPIKDSSNGGSYPRKPIAGSSNGDAYTRKPIKDSSNGCSYKIRPVKDSSNGDNYTRKPIKDSSNGGSFPRRPIEDFKNACSNFRNSIKDSSNGDGYPIKPIEHSSNGDSDPRKSIAGSSNYDNYTRKPIKYSSNSLSYPGTPVKDSSNGGSYLRRPIKDSSIGDRYPRKPIEDFLNGASNSRKPIEGSLNVASYSGKTNEGTSNYESRLRNVNFKNISNDQSYSESTIPESSNYENCCNRTIRGSSKRKLPLVFRKRLNAVGNMGYVSNSDYNDPNQNLDRITVARKRLNAVRIMRDVPNSDYNDSNRKLDDTIMNLSMSSVPKPTSALDYNSDDTLVGHSFSLYDFSDYTGKSFHLTSTPKGKRKSNGVKSTILMDTTSKSYSFCIETLSKADHRLESIKSCLRPNSDYKIVHSTHEVLSTDLLNSPYSFCKETLSKANLRLESILSCVRTKAALDKPTSKISCYLNTALQLKNYKRPFDRLSTKWTRECRQKVYYPSIETYLKFLNFERRQIEANGTRFAYWNL